MKNRGISYSLGLALIAVISLSMNLDSKRINTEVATIDKTEEQSFVANQIWWNNDWPLRRQINITNDGDTLTDYQVKVSLTSSNFNYTFCQANGEDIRFAYHNQEFNHWIENWVNGGTSTIWVKIPIISGYDITTIYLYYGNQTSASTSNGTNTFQVFDDFSRSTLNENLWAVSEATDGTQNYEVTNGELHTSIAIQYYGLHSGYIFTLQENLTNENFAITLHSRWENLDTYRAFGIFNGLMLRDDDNQGTGNCHSLYGDYRQALYQVRDGTLSNLIVGETTAGNSDVEYTVIGNNFNLSLSGTIDNDLVFTESGFHRPFNIQLYSRFGGRDESPVNVEVYFDLFYLRNCAAIVPVVAAIGMEEPKQPDEDNDYLYDSEEPLYGTNSTNPDTDSDGLLDGYEVKIYKTNPLVADSDTDGINDFDEIFLYDTNPLLTDSDLDGLTDGEEVNIYGTDPTLNDTDNDTLNDYDEIITYGTDPLSTDSDNDTMQDNYEVLYGLDPLVNDTQNDLDNDMLNNLYEHDLGTNPANNDTDGEGISDGDEVLVYFTSPFLNDTDFDILSDFDEIFVYFTNATNSDTDYDQYTDHLEITEGSDPNNATSIPNTIDSDGDSINDYDELVLGTDYFDADTDDDLLHDGLEYYTYHTDPLDPDTDSDSLTDFEEIFTYSTNPLNNDSDGDTLNDFDEIIIYDTNPNSADSDSDTLNDADELFIYGTNPILLDTDGDLLNDSFELFIYNTNPLNIDTDNDTLSDFDELLVYFIDPNNDDVDSDGLLDGFEVHIHGTNPENNDSDFDSITDFDEIVVYFTNPNSNDTDDDQLTDHDELFSYFTNPLLDDTDNDLLKDGEEIYGIYAPTNPGANATGYVHTNPLDADSDSDIYPDGLEIGEGSDPNNASSIPLTLDFDGDGLLDHIETSIGTNFTNPDSDNDGLTDGDEYHTYGTDPLNPDTDGDQLTDYYEINTSGTNPILADTDSDGLDDYQELVIHHTNPLVGDTDGDGLTDYYEINICFTNPLRIDTDYDDITDYDEIYVTDTDPTNNDSDGDGLKDGLEVSIGTDPNLVDTDGDGKTDYWEYTNDRDPLKKFELDRIFGRYLVPVYILPFAIVGMFYSVKFIRKKRDEENFKEETFDTFDSGYSFSFEDEEQAIREEMRTETSDDNS